MGPSGPQPPMRMQQEGPAAVRLCMARGAGVSSIPPGGVQYLTVTHASSGVCVCV